MALIRLRSSVQIRPELPISHSSMVERPAVNRVILVRVQVGERSNHGRVGEFGRPRHPVKVEIAGPNPVTTATGSTQKEREAGRRRPARCTGSPTSAASLPSRSRSSAGTSASTTNWRALVRNQPRTRSRGETDITPAYEAVFEGSSPSRSTGSLAQLAERPAHTGEVAGSNPARSTESEAKVAAAPGCEPGHSGFNSRHSPHAPITGWHPCMLG